MAVYFQHLVFLKTKDTFFFLFLFYSREDMLIQYLLAHTEAKIVLVMRLGLEQLLWTGPLSKLGVRK